MSYFFSDTVRVLCFTDEGRYLSLSLFKLIIFLVTWQFRDDKKYLQLVCNYG